MNDSRPLPRVIAHRGASVEAPENTLPAFRRAIEVGARAIEFDVHLTKDGHPVVIHDPFLERTTTGTGEVAALTLDEIRALDAGAWYDPAFKGERVPTLDEVLALASEAGIGVNVEIKVGEEPYDGIEQKVADAAARAGLTDRLFVSSFYPDVVQRFREVGPESAGTGVILLGPLQDEHVEKYGAFADAIGLYVDLVTEEAIATLHEAGKRVVAWTVNDVAIAKRLLDLGADAVITDDPRALKAFL